jgi:hypothetical protein
MARESVVGGSFAQGSEDLVVRHREMVAEFGREDPAVKPVLQEVHEMDVIDAADGMEIDLAEHLVAREQQRLGGLDAALLDAQLRRP